MDYKGQQLCEYIYFLLTVLSGGIAWIIGYVKSDFSITFYGWSIGLALSLLLCIPDWPFYNRNKIIWLDQVDKISSDKQGAKGSNNTPAVKTKSKKSKKEQ